MAALTTEQYYSKLLATCPDWFLHDLDASIYRGHLMGMAAVLNKLHQVALDHKTETFITDASQEFLEVHADERVIPSLGFIGENRVDQVQKIGSRASLDKIKDIVDRIIFDGTSEVHEGFLLDPSDPDGFPGRYLDLPYDDSEEQIVDWLQQRNVFTIVIDPQDVPSSSFLVADDIYCNRGSFIGSLESTVIVGKAILDAMYVYKAAGFLFRVIERTNGVYES